MRAFTKTILLVAAVLTLLFAVTACNRDDTPAPAPPAATPAPPAGGDTAAATPTPVVPDTPAPAHDGPPRVIRFTSWFEHGGHFGIFDETPDPATSNDFEIDMMQYENMLRVMEQFNVEFQVVSVGDYEAFGDAFLAGQFANDPIGDIVWLASSMMHGPIMAGQLVDFNTLRPAGSDLHGARNYIRPTVEVGGGMWAIRNNSPNAQAFFLGFNNVLGERIGIADPVALYEAGNWTWDAFLSMARAAGAAGYHGASGWIRDFAQGFITANDGMISTPDFQYGLDHPNTMEALEFIATLFEENLYWNDPEAEDSGMWDWWALSTAFANGDVLFFAIEHWHRGMVDTQMDFRALPFPRGPNGRSGFTTTGGYEVGWVIPQGVEDPQFVLEVIEALLSWPGDDLWILQEGVRAHYRPSFMTEGCLERNIRIANEQLRFDPGFPAGIADRPADIMIAVFNGTETVASAVEYWRGPSQEALDNAFR